MRTAIMVALVGLLQVASLGAEEQDRDTRVREAAERGLKIVARGAKNYPEHRKCFSCHHQTLPLLALEAASAQKYEVDRDVIKPQLEFTQAFFAGRKDELARGDRIGGAAATVSYGLWTYEIGQVPADEVTDAMVANLLKLQEADGRWRPPSVRPPLEESHVACTVLSAYGVQQYGRDAQADAAKEAFARADAWLATAKLESTEDYFYAAAWHACFKPDTKKLETMVKPILALQREDGGFAQTPQMESDAYATGQMGLLLVTLALLDPDAEVERARVKAVDYLLKTQQADGSWHVKTRSKPVQKFFDNGDPHGKDQFISMAATSWAVTALIGDGYLLE